MYDNGEPKNDIIDMREPEKKETEKPAVKEIPFETAKKDITDERQIPPSKPSAAFDPKPAPPPSLPPPYHPYKPDARYYGRRRYDRRGIVAWLVALGVVFLMINVMGYNEAGHVRVISSRAHKTPAGMSYDLAEPVPYAMSSTEYIAEDVPMVADAVFAAADVQSIESELVAATVNIYENDGPEIVIQWMSDRGID
ncbi:MAG: hypothetical protein LBS19_08870, partial [Clostridiales bacterium]|nr:hypothetical protein [Clostridiales bacterium]